MSPEELLSLGLSRELVVLVISTLPISELRGAIPVAINVFGFPWYKAYLLAVAGNLIPVPFLLLFFNGAYRVLGKIDFIRRFFDWIIKRTRERGGLVEKYERIGLMLFVAIPLPVTGAWTGSFAAVIFGIKPRYASLSIIAGVLIAGVIVTCLSLLGWTGALIAGLCLVILAVFGLWKI
ncbi:COG2426 family protein [Chloroflexota bacterium]